MIDASGASSIPLNLPGTVMTGGGRGVERRARRAVAAGIGGVALRGMFVLRTVRPDPRILGAEHGANLSNSRVTLRVRNDGGDGDVLVRLSYDDGSEPLRSEEKTAFVACGDGRDVRFDSLPPRSADGFEASVRADDVLGSLFGLMLNLTTCW